MTDINSIRREWASFISKKDDAISNLTLLCGESYHVWSDSGVAWGLEGSSDYWLFLDWNVDKKISTRIFDTLESFAPARPKTGEMGYYAVIGYCHLHGIPVSINERDLAKP